MKYLEKFSSFEQLFEATFNLAKTGISYIPNSKGEAILKRMGYTITSFESTTEKPKIEDEILVIKPSSFSIDDYQGEEDFLFYKTGIEKPEFAVARINSTSTVVVQKERSGGSKRGDYFRETAFLIVLGQRVWQTLGLKIPVYGKIEEIVFQYDTYEDDTRDSFVVTGADKSQFDRFCENDEIYKSFIGQADALIQWLDTSINDVSYFVKNANDLLPNYIAEELIQDEIEFFQDVRENATDFEGIDYYKIPEKASLEKWNPSDMWICYKGFEDGFGREKFWYPYNSSIDELNEFFRESLNQKIGIVGVSLKQQMGDFHKTYTVNIKPTEIKHSFLGDDINSKTKTASINYKYFIDKIEGMGKIDFRTFDGKINSGLGIEVKGSIKSTHVSGKAGAILKYILPEDVYYNIDFIKKEKDIFKIAEKFRPSLFDLSGPDYEFKDKQVESVFLDDLEKVKNSDTNSRMQAAILFDWFLSQQKSKQNKIISEIIRFAKSESDWSAPHLILK
jgi:hypothetical protein